jgi:hypothetical protein
MRSGAKRSPGRGEDKSGKSKNPKIEKSKIGNRKTRNRQFPVFVEDRQKANNPGNPAIRFDACARTLGKSFGWRNFNIALTASYLP